MENNKSIEKLIENSLKELSRIGDENAIQQDAESRLLFPKYRNGDKRVSEQELRFLLARELENQKKYYYSVETPTEDKYSFEGDSSLSARIDLSLHDSNGKRLNLIEFKYKNVDVKNDFLKLLCDLETDLNYFVQFVDNNNKDTIPSIENKYQEALASIHKNRKEIKSNVKIILFVISTRIFYKYEINKDGLLNKVEG